jgi:oligoribonuclease NrnB/cAMP/cGMP phosphodiesterase (DHH superfamily)
MGDFIYSATNYSQESGQIIVADLGLNDELIDICKQIFSDATGKGWRITWVDHHPWSQQAVEAIKPLVEIVLDASGKKCASDLMYEKFLPGNLLAENLAGMAHTMDFFTKDQYLTPISELIRYYQTFPDFYNRLSDLARKSARGTLWDVKMQTDYDQYAKLRDDAKVEVFAGMQIRPVGNIKVAYLQSSPYLQSSLFADEVFAKTGADLVMLYSNKGKVIIRRNNNSISCSDVASNLSEGGGHPYAAGAVFKSDPANPAEVIAELEGAVVKALNLSRSQSGVDSQQLHNALKQH